MTVALGLSLLALGALLGSLATWLCCSIDVVGSALEPRTGGDEGELGVWGVLFLMDGTIDHHYRRDTLVMLPAFRCPHPVSDGGGVWVFVWAYTRDQAFDGARREWERLSRNNFADLHPDPFRAREAM